MPAFCFQNTFSQHNTMNGTARQNYRILFESMLTILTSWFGKYVLPWPDMCGGIYCTLLRMIWVEIPVLRCKEALRMIQWPPHCHGTSSLLIGKLCNWPVYVITHLNASFYWIYLVYLVYLVEIQNINQVVGHVLSSIYVVIVFVPSFKKIQHGDWWIRISICNFACLVVIILFEKWC